MSYSLDTNGGNDRYVKASQRWGKDPSVLKALALGNQDPAGVVGRFEEAARRYGGVSIRSAHKSEAYFEFPRDILWNRSTDAMVKRLAREADVIHLNNSPRAYQVLHLRQPALLHHHGSLFRNDPAYMLGLARHRGFVSAVSTIDLLKPAPDELTWLPTAYDVDALVEYGAAHRREPDGRLRVVSAPTNRTWKSTDALEIAVRGMRAEGLPVDLVLIEGKTWAQCLELKATADVYFDQVILGYGCNAIEAWGMGIPVIAGADPWTLDQMRAHFGELPFYEATPETIASAIRAMLKPDLRAEYAERGMAHIRRFHDERPALAKLCELYAKAMTQRKAQIPIPAVRPAPGQSWSQLMAERKAKVTA